MVIKLHVMKIFTRSTTNLFAVQRTFLCKVCKKIVMHVISLIRFAYNDQKFIETLNCETCIAVRTFNMGTL